MKNKFCFPRDLHDDVSACALDGRVYDLRRRCTGARAVYCRQLRGVVLNTVMANKVSFPARVRARYKYAPRNERRVVLKFQTGPAHA